MVRIWWKNYQPAKSNWLLPSKTMLSKSDISTLLENTDFDEYDIREWFREFLKVSRRYDLYRIRLFFLCKGLSRRFFIKGKGNYFWSYDNFVYHLYPHSIHIFISLFHILNYNLMILISFGYDINRGPFL